jgi:hypothetical protein
VPAPTPPFPDVDCQSCGACCACDPDWPRFSLESDEQLDRIPAALVDDGLGRMRWTGDRCAALAGVVGERVACTIYDIRPDVCRACEPGDDACRLARAKWGMG